MARTSEDPYGDFVVRVMNSCRIATSQAMDMSDDEYYIVCRVLDELKRRDPNATEATRASIIIRRR